MAKIGTYTVRDLPLGQVIVTVKISRLLRYRLWLAMILFYCGSWIIGAPVSIETES